MKYVAAAKLSPMKSPEKPSRKRARKSAKKTSAEPVSDHARHVLALEPLPAALKTALAARDGALAARRFDLRISSAIIELTESDFSDFTGFTRYILPLEGEITLLKDGRRILLSHNELYRFEGDEVVSSENTKGAIDFNIIVRHGIDVEVGIVQDECFSDSRKTVVFALEDISIDGERIGKYDTATLAKPFCLKGKAAVARFAE